MTRRGAGGAAALAPLGLTAITLGLTAMTLDWPADTLDEMILVVYPERMMAGDLPYRDFFTAYGPAHWWLLQGFYELAGAGVQSARLLGMGFHVVLVLATYWCLLPRGRWIAVAGGVISALLLSSLGAAPYAWLLAATLCLTNVAVLMSRARGRLPLAGVAAGAAIAVRPDVGLLAVLPALPFLWGSWPQARRWGAGLVAGLAPLWLGLALTGQELLANVLGARAGRGAGQSRLPLWPLEAPARQLLLLLLVSVLLGCALALRRRSQQDVALALLGLAALPQAFQRADAVHFVYAGLLSVPFLPLLCRELVRSRYGSAAARRAALAAGLLFVLTTPEWVTLPLVDELRGTGPRSTLVEHEGRQLPLGPSAAASLNELLVVLDRETEPGTTLFVYDRNLVRPAISDVGLYHLLPSLRQRAYNMEITPGVTAFPGGRLVEDLQQADIAVLIDVPEDFRAALFPYAKSGTADAQEELEQHFCLVAEVDYYLVYRRCGSGT